MISLVIVVFDAFDGTGWFFMFLLLLNIFFALFYFHLQKPSQCYLVNDAFHCEIGMPLIVQI